MTKTIMLKQVNLQQRSNKKKQLIQKLHKWFAVDTFKEHEDSIENRIEDKQKKRIDRENKELAGMKMVTWRGGIGRQCKIAGSNRKLLNDGNKLDDDDGDGRFQLLRRW